MSSHTFTLFVSVTSWILKRVIIPFLVITLFSLPTLVSQGNLMKDKREQLVPVFGKDGSVEVTPINIGGVTGSWAIRVMRDPSFKNVPDELSANDRYLDFYFGGADWEAIFFDVLKCPDANIEPRSTNEEREEWESRYMVKFQQAIPDYPLLGRMWDMYIYVSYKPEEIEQLRNECLKVQSSTSNEKAIVSLGKFLTACDEASKHGSGLLFVPD